MSKLRSVSTAFWSDPFIEELPPNEKLLFLYFITNEKTNMLGIYEVSIRKISYDTGLDKNEINKALKSFERLNKVKFVNNHIVLINFLKHQSFNTNMKKSAIDVFNNLPKELNNSGLVIDKVDVDLSFERLSKHLLILPKIEYELEAKLEAKYELETKTENKEISFEILESDLSSDKNNSNFKKEAFNIFWDAYDKKQGLEACEKKFLKLSKEVIEKILEVVPHYVKSTPDKKYRKQPSTWLNNKGWNDEIINNNNPSNEPKQQLIGRTPVDVLRHNLDVFNNVKIPD